MLDAALVSHCQRFNTAVANNDFAAVVDHFAPDAEMIFEGADVGPFHGREEIAEAYRQSPPDDQILLLHADVLSEDTVTGDYAWAAAPGTRAGQLRLTMSGDLISRLVVTFS